MPCLARAHPLERLDVRLTWNRLRLSDSFALLFQCRHRNRRRALRRFDSRSATSRWDLRHGAPPRVERPAAADNRSGLPMPGHGNRPQPRWVGSGSAPCHLAGNSEGLSTTRPGHNPSHPSNRSHVRARCTFALRHRQPPPCQRPQEMAIERTDVEMNSGRAELTSWQNSSQGGGPARATLTVRNLFDSFYRSSTATRSRQFTPAGPTLRPLSRRREPRASDG